MMCSNNYICICTCMCLFNYVMKYYMNFQPKIKFLLSKTQLTTHQIEWMSIFFVYLYFYYIMINSSIILWSSLESELPNDYFAQPHWQKATILTAIMYFVLLLSARSWRIFLLLWHSLTRWWSSSYVNSNFCIFIRVSSTENLTRHILI